MPRIFKGIESELRLLLHPCILTGEITDIKVALFTNDPSVAIEFTDRYTIDDNILTLTVPTWAFGTMEDGVINYVIQGMHNDDAFITDRQSNYYLKTPTDYIPEEMPEEVVLGELTTMIVENGVFEYTPSDVDAWNKATIEVNVPDINGAYDEGYNQGYEDGQNSVECPEGGTCNLGEGEIVLDTTMAGFYELYAAEDGYDGWSKFYVTLENGGAIKIHKAEELIQMFNEGWGIDFGAYYYVGGKITDIQEISTEWGNATYTLDNGFKVYRGKWIDGNTFSDENQIKVGAYIVVYGVIADYRGTLQFNAGSQVIAYQECEGGEIVSCNLEDKWVTPSMGDRDDNGYVVVEESEGFDGLSRVVIDPTTIYNEGVSAGKAEGGNLNIDAVSTSLGVGTWNKWTRNAAEYGLDGMSEITIDGSQYQEWTKAYTLLQAYQNTEEAYITENGEYRANIGYDGFALKGYNVGWVIDVVPTIDTDVEIWVKPYDGAPNSWQGFIGSQVSDDDNTTFQIRKMDGNNAFSFKFGEQTYDYWFEYERWYRLRMNRNGVWVNGEQVCGWDVQAFEENPNPLMINGIYNLGFESENYRMNSASYGYVYFHNTDSLLVPSKNGLFIGNKNQTIGRPATSDAFLQYENNWYPKGYTKVIVDVQNGGGNCDDAYNNGYNDGYNDGQANCGGGSANLINPIIFSESEGNTINAESVQIPTFVYEGNQHYNVWALNMADYEEFKIQIKFQPSNGGNEEPVNIFGCENTDWDDTTFGARIYMGNIYFRMSGEDVAYPYNESAWYDAEMGYNSSKRWIIVNGETILETDHAFVNKPSQNFMIGAINSGGNAFRPFYGKIAATYIEANGSQVWLLPKEEGHMDVYWNDRSSPWVSLNGESNARFETDWLSGDGMKSITWLGKRVSCPSTQEQVNEYYYCPLILGDTGFGEAAKSWDAGMVTLNDYDGNIIEDKLYVPTYGNRNEFRTKTKAKIVQTLYNVGAIGSIEFGSGVEYIALYSPLDFTKLTKLIIGEDMQTANFGTSTFPIIKEIWSYSTTSEIDVYFSLGSTFNGGGTLYLKNKDHETEWRNHLPSDWTIVYI